MTIAPSRRRLALAATALAGIVAVNLVGLPGSPGVLRLRRTLGNLSSPYAAHTGADVEAELERRRQLTIWRERDNGSIMCKMARTKGPNMIDPNAEYQNTIVVGYPGADKRTVVRQMEAMTQLSGRDSWDFKFLGMTKQPFIKTNYPHHEGIWGWQDHGDQVILVIRNIKQTILDYHDILADIDYAKTWSEATEMIPRLFKGEIEGGKYARWRDERTMDEIGWYGWLIDYWMEGGILRDYFDHKLTTKEHWAKLRQPETYTYGELQWDVNICTTDPLPGVTYDDLCDPAVTQDCKAKVVIGAEKLMDPATGQAENRKVAELLTQTTGISDELVDEQAWDCFYDLLIGNNVNGSAPENTEGYHDYRSREQTFTHVLSTRHLTKMVEQLTRLINKYSALDPETGMDWANSATAQQLVDILTAHRTEVQADLDETSTDQNWAHPPKPNWVVFPKCGDASRRVWDYDYPHKFSGFTIDMFPELTA